MLSISAAEDRVAALEKTLSGRGDVAKSEAEVRRQLAQVQKELDKYRAVYGNASSLPPDVAQLSEQLQRKQQELDKVQLQDREREQVCIASNSSLTTSNLIYVSRLNPPCIASWISFLPLGKPSTNRSRRRSMTWLR